MLISKKILYLLHHIKKHTPLKKWLTTTIAYTWFNKDTSSTATLISILKIVFTVKVRVNTTFLLKVVVPNIKIFNSIILTVFNKLIKNDLALSLSFGKIISKKKIYTLLRSPFVYKKTREQLLTEFYRGYVYINLKPESPVLMEYLTFFLKSGLSNTFSMRGILKKISTIK